MFWWNWRRLHVRTSACSKLPSNRHRTYSSENLDAFRFAQLSITWSWQSSEHEPENVSVLACGQPSRAHSETSGAAASLRLAGRFGWPLVRDACGTGPAAMRWLLGEDAGDACSVVVSRLLGGGSSLAALPRRVQGSGLVSWSAMSCDREVLAGSALVVLL